MKKILLVGMLVVSGLSFGRDYEYREGKELKVVEQRQEVATHMMSRERGISEKNMDTYSSFHEDLNNMDRGNERR